ncbi:MAG: Ig-like domain-containing protein [Prevotellaceae bacterium]|nr:Ig-like domain-containing protein [Prevotellaceae bacterium]
MKKVMFFFAAILLFAACGPEPDNGEEAKGMTLRDTSITLGVGETFRLVPVFDPADAKPTLTWESNNTAAVTVSGVGIVTGVAEGTATIKVTTANGLEATCQVEVRGYYNNINIEGWELFNLVPTGTVTAKGDSIGVYTISIMCNGFFVNSSYQLDGPESGPIFYIDIMGTFWDAGATQPSYRVLNAPGEVYTPALPMTELKTFEQGWFSIDSLERYIQEYNQYGESKIKFRGGAALDSVFTDEDGQYVIYWDGYVEKTSFGLDLVDDKFVFSSYDLTASVMEYTEDNTAIYFDEYHYRSSGASGISAKSPVLTLDSKVIDRMKKIREANPWLVEHHAKRDYTKLIKK